MLPPSHTGIKHFFSFQNPITLLYETYVDESANIPPQDDSDAEPETLSSPDQ